MVRTCQLRQTFAHVPLLWAKGQDIFHQEVLESTPRTRDHTYIAEQGESIIGNNDRIGTKSERTVTCSPCHCELFQRFEMKMSGIEYCSDTFEGAKVALFGMNDKFVDRDRDITSCVRWVC